jgi:hypothetical protein
VPEELRAKNASKREPGALVLRLLPSSTASLLRISKGSSRYWRLPQEGSTSFVSLLVTLISPPPPTLIV